MKTRVLQNPPPPPEPSDRAPPHKSSSLTSPSQPRFSSPPHQPTLGSKPNINHRTQPHPLWRWFGISPVMTVVLSTLPLRLVSANEVQVGNECKAKTLEFLVTQAEARAALS
ncbi:unnamed protein product [Arabis nemorensis]|uniref:Uncharacterized protein n=1 Tax=Arabis nemorensis TaxID=586526 RepID=A0A565CB30_9BRAS|nr:unnamed protein product [Arabis nemorensis]